MQKYISLFFSVLLFLTACQSEELPKGVLNEKDMISLLLDVHLTDGEVYQVPQVPDSMYKYSSAKFVVVFKKHHTTAADFKTSYKYYSKQPERIQAMYGTLETLIKAKIDSLNKTGAAAASAAAKAASVRPVPNKPVTDTAAKPATPKLPLNRFLNKRLKKVN